MTKAKVVEDADIVTYRVLFYRGGGGVSPERQLKGCYPGDSHPIACLV
jgi:hypothetical protein